MPRPVLPDTRQRLIEAARSLFWGVDLRLGGDWLVLDTPTATRVRLVQTGWQQDAEWDAAYDDLELGNAPLLMQLHRRFTSGPLDWSKFT